MRWVFLVLVLCVLVLLAIDIFWNPRTPKVRFSVPEALFNMPKALFHMPEAVFRAPLRTRAGTLIPLVAHLLPPYLNEEPWRAQGWTVKRWTYEEFPSGQHIVWRYGGFYPHTYRPGARSLRNYLVYTGFNDMRILFNDFDEAQASTEGMMLIDCTRLDGSLFLTTG